MQPPATAAPSNAAATLAMRTPASSSAMPASRSVHAWLLPLGLVLLWAGYFGPWIPHAAAALSLNALDL